MEGQKSIGKPRAEEATRLLLELNDGVQGHAVVNKGVEEVLGSEDGSEWVKGFTLIVAHNLEKASLERLSDLLWADVKSPPLVVIRSAGFLAEVFIQFHEHAG